MIFRRGRWVAHAQANKLVAIKPGVFNDTPEPHQTFWGVGATRYRSQQAAEAVYSWVRSRHRPSGRHA